MASSNSTRSFTFVLAAVGAAVVIVASVLTLLTGGDVELSTETAGDVDGRPAKEVVDTATAEVSAAGLSRSDESVKRTSVEEVVEVDIVELGTDTKALENLKAKLDRRRWGERGDIEGSVRGYFAPGVPLDVEFVAGLNTGRKAVVKDGEINFTNLELGAGIVQLTVGKRKYLRDVVVSLYGAMNFDFDLDNSAWARASLTDNVTNLPLVNPSVDIDGIRQFANRDGEFFLDGLSNGRSLVYSAAKGYESRRTVVKWGSHRSGEIEAVKIIQRRSTPIVVTFDGLSDGDEPPVVVVVPKHAPTSVAFEKCCVVKGIKGVKQLVVEGIPSDEDVKVYMLAITAVAAPGFRELSPLDPAATISRQARFTFESRKPLRGQVLHEGEPVKGAIVKVEAESHSAATESFFGPAAIGSFPFPVLPCARKIVNTDENGEFNVEVADIRLPARLTITKAGLVPWTQDVPSGSFNLGGLELKSSPSDVEAAEDPATLVLEFPDARPRFVKAGYLPRGAVKPRMSESRFTGTLSGGIAIGPGVHSVRIGKGPSAQNLTITAKGETRVKVASAGVIR